MQNTYYFESNVVAYVSAHSLMYFGHIRRLFTHSLKYSLCIVLMLFGVGHTGDDKNTPLRVFNQNPNNQIFNKPFGTLCYVIIADVSFDYEVVNTL